MALARRIGENNKEVNKEGNMNNMSDVKNIQSANAEVFGKMSR